MERKDMKVLEIYPESINERFIALAVSALEKGGIIVYPTDTLYAFGCDCLNQRAIERLCRIKGLNPDKNLLSIVCSDLSQASEYARIDNRAFRLLKEYLPGPFTFILPASTTLPKVFKGRKSVGVRIPDNAIARSLAEALGRPILSSSVTSGDEDEIAEMSSASSIAMRYETTSLIELVIDGGDCGLEGSTVVDCLDSSSPEVVRQGVGEFV